MMRVLRSAALLLVLAIPGCVARVDARITWTESPATLTTLEDLAWPIGEDGWRPLDEAQLRGLERLITGLIDEAERGRPSLARRRALEQFAALVGVELERVHVTAEGRELDLWVVHEPTDDRRGRGTYLIRIGRAPREQTGLLLQAPHSRFDRHTGAIALDLLLADERGAIRAVFLDSAHRHRKADGSRDPRPDPADNPADPAHNAAHPFARATAAVLAEREWVLVQLHGFDHGARPGQPELIVASGRAEPNPASAEMLVELRAGLSEYECGHYGIDTDRLGARQNVQARAARASGRCFVQLELSEPLRERLREQPDLRRRFAAAVLGGASEEARGGCR
jgi:hypothetical protein